MIRGFLLGMRESRGNVTTRIEGRGENAYEYGRRIVRFVMGWE